MLDFVDVIVNCVLKLLNILKYWKQILHSEKYNVKT